MPDYHYWNERWLNNQIGFHMLAPNPLLIEFIDLFVGHKKVLVPLCGKSPDLIFLKNSGLEVIGVEFSEVAILDFIKENNLSMTKSSHGDLNLYTGSGFTIYQGDLFKLTSDELKGVTCCYDRASMVALNYEERVRYAHFLSQTASDLKFILAPLLDYGDLIDSGPPFSVTANELTKLYGPYFELNILKKTETPVREMLKAKGAVYEKEVTWIFKKRF